ncbi:polysaccharide lyase family 1 protein [Cupriavidus oxalaticus]|uniref:polysaccharide lyase family 1 protein n=1 Tax=Cupriavidus oxalaticus TaxID=96344 RepID=UPI00317A2AAE
MLFHIAFKRATLALGSAAFLLNLSGSCATEFDFSRPKGFGAATIGGMGGEVVNITDPIDGRKQLKNALCNSFNAEGVCSDATPRIIRIATTIDYTGTEKTSSERGCYPGKTKGECPTPYEPEALILVDANDRHCSGKEVTGINYDVAGKNPLSVGSNKTLIGASSSAALKGKGLRPVNSRNVEIRNLTISDINNGIVFGGDAISLEGVDRVWIDHNTFHNIGRQMIVGHFRPAINVTISWNNFDGTSAYSPECNGKHYWNILLIAKKQTITLSNNWFHDFSGRAPKVSGDEAIVHVVNNYFQNGSWHALDSSENAHLFVEANYFDNVILPILPDDGYVFGALGSLSAVAQRECKEKVGRPCLGNLAIPEPSINGFTQYSAVMEAFGALGKNISHSSKSEVSSCMITPYAASKVPAIVKAYTGTGHL